MSTYKTRPVGEIFKFDEVKLKVVEDFSCEGCYLDTFDCCLNFRKETGYCSKVVRYDNKSVIFKQIIE